MGRDFVPDTVLKRDAFSEVVMGRDASGTRLLLRRLSGVPWWSRWLAWGLARREIAGLRAVSGVRGCPELLQVDREGILRSWTEGRPLQEARPSEPGFYRDARRLLREIRRRGVAHNDLAKPQNWLMTPEGGAAVIDFQLATVHRRRGALWRALAYEDLRHLVKQKRAYAKAHLTASERRMLGRRALPSRVWMATGKPLYVFVTRRILRWSDAEGGGRRLTEEAPAIQAALAGLGAAEVVAYPRAAGGVGLYAFVETAASEEAVRGLLGRRAPDLVQCVGRLPRRADGSLRGDLLVLVATNRIAEAQALIAAEPGLAEVGAALVAGRRNLTDRARRRL